MVSTPLSYPIHYGCHSSAPVRVSLQNTSLWKSNCILDLYLHERWSKSAEPQTEMPDLLIVLGFTRLNRKGDDVP